MEGHTDLTSVLFTPRDVLLTCRHPPLGSAREQLICTHTFLTLNSIRVGMVKYDHGRGVCFSARGDIFTNEVGPSLKVHQSPTNPLKHVQQRGYKEDGHVLKTVKRASGL